VNLPDSLFEARRWSASSDLEAGAVGMNGQISYLTR
jgi:hypothetical protein